MNTNQTAAPFSDIADRFEVAPNSLGWRFECRTCHESKSGSLAPAWAYSHNHGSFGNASYGPYRVLVPGDFSRADRTRVIWVDYLFENGRGGTAPIEAILFDADT